MKASVLCINLAPETEQAVTELLADRMPEGQTHAVPDPDVGLTLARMEQPDLILIDLRRLEDPAANVLDRFRRDTKTQHIPLLRVPENDDGLADGFVPEPVDAETLTIEIKAWLRGRELEKRYLDTLAESETRFRALFDHSPDAIFIQNRGGIILDVNPAAVALHGASGTRGRAHGVPRR
ncbi:MAG: PAS domain-containing protein [Verrucomicrobiota bacterium]